MDLVTSSWEKSIKKKYISSLQKLLEVKKKPTLEPVW